MSDWKETARKLVSKLPDPRFEAGDEEDWVRAYDGIAWRYEDRAGWPDWLPDLIDHATAGVLLGMLAQYHKDWGPAANHAALYLVSDTTHWGHAVALALLEAHS